MLTLGAKASMSEINSPVKYIAWRELVSCVIVVFFVLSLQNSVAFV